MTTNKSFHHPISIPFGEPTHNCDAIRRNPNFGHTNKSIEGFYTLDAIFENSVKKYSNYPCMGWRKLKKMHKETITSEDGIKKIVEIPEFYPLHYESYATIGEKVDHFGKGIVHFANLKPHDKVGIFEETRAEWQIAAQALLKQNQTIVTVYANLGEEALLYSIQETEITTMIVNAKHVKKLLEFSEKCPSLKYLIYIDELPNMEKHENIKSFEEIIQLGSKITKNVEKPPQPDDIALIMYTSGSTGVPKGVMISHLNMVTAIGGALDGIGMKAGMDIYCAYLPLAHIFEFLCEMAALAAGARIGYGSPKTLTDTGAKPMGDLVAIRPTILTAVPKVCDTVRKGILEKIHAKGSIFAWLFRRAFDAKYAAIQKGLETPFWDKIIFNSLKSALGGNLRVIVSGGAPLSEESHKFMRVCFGAPVIQGYGLTETCASATMQIPSHPYKPLVVGGPTTCCEIKLQDVPDMGYTHLDKPYPRGEILLRGKHISKGYFKQPETTKEAYDEDGWFHTGDIGQWLPDGSLQIIDRKKNLIKLAHGEYVAIENLESLYGNSPFVSPNGLCIYGDSYKTFLVAMVLPQESFLLSWAKKHGIEGDFKSLCNNLKVRKAVLESFKRIAERNKKKRFEYIQDCRIYPDEWTPENGLRSAALKLQRSKIIQRYQHDIDEMYNEREIKSKL